MPTDPNPGAPESVPFTEQMSQALARYLQATDEAERSVDDFATWLTADTDTQEG